jgi:hypothetical protein
MAEDIRPEEAVRAAKRWLTEVYAEEAIAEVALEEVRFRDGNWEITLGFERSIVSRRRANLDRSTRRSDARFIRCLCWPGTTITSWRCATARLLERAQDARPGHKPARIAGGRSH